MDLIEAVAAVDPAVGWCLVIGASVVGSACSRLSEEGLAELLAGNETPRMSGSLRPGGVSPWGGWLPHHGSLELEQRYRPCHLGQRPLPNLTDGETPGPPVMAAVLRRSDVEVHDNWFTAGMRGSGSSGTAVFSDNVLQQSLGDLHVASAHLMVSDSAYELYGADRLGSNPDSSIAGMT